MITLRKPMKVLLILNQHMEWQVGYRERLMKQIENSEQILDSDEFFKYYHNMSKTCPSCFCPNLESFFSDYSNKKGFWCPACGNAFEMPIKEVTEERYIWSVE